MRLRRVLVALLLVLVGVLLQTTVFHSVRPFGASPDMALLMVIGCVRWLDAEVGVVLGFIAGLLLDLFGTAPLGLNALAFTLAAYMTARAGDRFYYGIHFALAAVVSISFVSLGAVALIGTLFGEGTLGSPGVIRTLLLVPAYNMLLATVVLPGVGRMLVSSSQSTPRRPSSLL